MDPVTRINCQIGESPDVVILEDDDKFVNLMKQQSLRLCPNLRVIIAKTLKDFEVILNKGNCTGKTKFFLDNDVPNSSEEEEKTSPNFEKAVELVRGKCNNAAIYCISGQASTIVK